MTLALATIPADDTLAGWLESRIVGGELRPLVAELAALHNAAPPGDSVRDRLGRYLKVVLTRGFVGLEPSIRAKVVRHILKQPYYLLEIQEAVLTEGGSYWDSVPKPKALADEVNRSKERLAEALFGAGAEPKADLAPVATVTAPNVLKPAALDSSAASATESVRASGPRWYRSLPAAVLATAASVCVATLIVTGFFTRPGPVSEPRATTAPEWGWAKAGGIPDEPDRAKYLDALAARAEEWFDARPADADALSRRLSEFRLGCAVFQLAPHVSLAPEAREELKKKCRNWATKFDGFLAAVETGQDPAAIRTEADATVRKLVTTLRAAARES